METTSKGYILGAGNSNAFQLQNIQKLLVWLQPARLMANYTLAKFTARLGQGKKISY